MQKSETLNPEHVRGEMGKLDPNKATETSMDRTNEDGERLPQRRTTRKQWQRNAFADFTGASRNPRELARELMTENRKKYISKSLIRRHGETPGCLECLRVSSRHMTCQDVEKVLTVWSSSRQCNTSIRLLGMKRGAEDHPMFSSAKRAHAIHLPEPQILPRLRVEMEMMPVPEDAMESQPDVETGTEPVRSGTTQTNSTWKRV